MTVVDHTASLEPGPVNLDGMDQSELEAFVKATGDPWPERAAERMFPGEPDGMRTVRMLQQYASNRIRAMGGRALGEIEFALKHEIYCQRYYNELPEYARW